MKKLLFVFSVAALLAASSFAQSAPAGNLNQVLALLDRTSATFRTAQADFIWDQYQKVVDEHDIQKGVIYFRRSGNNVDVAADIGHADGKQSDRRKLVFTGGDVKIYSYKTRQVTSYPAGKNREEVESFLALGFGGRASDLQKNFDIHYAGVENIDGRPTYKLELTPKAEKVRNMFRQITLWIDQQIGISLQQKAMEGEYDYRLAKYPFGSLKLNQKLPPDAFKLP